MKTAICISGLPRFGSFAFRGFAENVIRGLDCDVFVFLWRQKNQSEDEVRMLAEQYIAPYAPITAYTICEQVEFSAKDYATHMHPGSSPFNIQSMYYALKGANQLKIAHERKHNMRYDCVVRTRVDVSCLSPFDLRPYQSLLNDYMFVPEVCYIGNGLNDTFAFSSSAHMDALSELYDWLDPYFRQGVLYNPHVMLLYHLMKRGIPHAYLSIPVEIVNEVRSPLVRVG